MEILDDISSFSQAESWDNVGLMVGDPHQPVSGILVALDPTEHVLDEALSQGMNTIVTHHPLLFNPLKSVRLDQPIGRFLTKALKNNIAVVGCHTNLDKTTGGVGDTLALQLGLADTKALISSDTSEHGNGSDDQNQLGFGRIGRVSPPLSTDSFLDRLLTVLDIPSMQIAGELPDQIETIAVCPGSGSDLAETALKMGAQVYITGEVKLSVARWAEMSGFCVVDAGHFATENVIVPAYAAALQKALADKNCSVTVKPTTTQANPFRYYTRVNESIIIQ